MVNTVCNSVIVCLFSSFSFHSKRHPLHTDSYFLKTVSWPPSRRGFWCMASLWGIWLSSRCYASRAPTLKTCVCPGIVLNRSSELSWLLWSPLVKTVIFHFHCFWESVLNWSWPLKWQIVVKKYRCISFSYAEFDLPNSSLIAENTKTTKELETVQARLLV